MKPYKGVMGAAGVAASLGLFVYVSRDAVYEEPETGEFPEENPEYALELPAEEAPSTPENTQKDTPETKRSQKAVNSPENKTKGRTAENPTYHPAFPKLSNLEKFLEGEEERPAYDLPPEERHEKTRQELESYFEEALKAYDFKVAESYTEDLTNLDRQSYRAFIVGAYDHYLDGIIADCQGQDFDSVFRKVVWMNFFILQHPETLIEDRTETIRATLINKGNQALEAVEYCSEKKTP